MSDLYLTPAEISRQCEIYQRRAQDRRAAHRRQLLTRRVLVGLSLLLFSLAAVDFSQGQHVQQASHQASAQVNQRLGAQLAQANPKPTGRASSSSALTWQGGASGGMPIKKAKPHTGSEKLAGLHPAIPYREMIVAAARRHGLEPALLAGLIRQESGFDPSATSYPANLTCLPQDRYADGRCIGARGLTQLMPATARGLGVTDSYDPAQNLEGGATYLAAQIKRFGSLRSALAAYNAGPGAVERYQRERGLDVPPYPETQHYVQVILHNRAVYRSGRILGS